MAPDSSGNEQQHISEHKGNNRTIYSISSAKRDGKDNQVWVSRAPQERGEHWTSSVSKEVALKAAGSGSWHWDSDSDIPALPHALACYRYCLSPSSQAQKDKEGPGGRAGSSCALYMHTHWILAHFSSSSSAEQDTAQGTHGQQLTARAINHSAALAGKFLCKVPPTPNKVCHALYILYSAELGVLSRFPFCEKNFL